MLTRLSLYLLALFSPASSDSIHQRTYFYVGGNYSVTENGEHVYTNQIYVEKLTPVQVTQPYPIVFIHGQAQTATNWLNKPDGQSGWASYFLDKGYECYLFDQPFRGRSPWQIFNGRLETYSAEHLQRYFTAPERYGLWPQASLHTQWPGSGVMHDPIFDSYYAGAVPFVSDNVLQQTAMRDAGAALLDQIGRPVILIAHSQGGIMAWLLADQRSDLVHSIVSIEPGGPPFSNAMFGNSSARAYGLTDIPIAYSPPVSDPSTDFSTTILPSNSSILADCIIQVDDPPARQLANLRDVPVLLVTTEASYHAQYDWCTVEFLQQAGVQAEHLQLSDIDIHGNGHMVFLEKNSDEVAAVIHRRIEQSDDMDGKAEL
ncbi:alpha/beta-hydrolase [Aspergillus eucalypticola CBS 122712]|uniref:Alpha/beta-hydrolase n=1 Tax=Aspergillus eucalypticola (strain CBS 122712 / IBT 29274) TaxID=1448314 RepID=A0A317VCL8_ASPEC|nr:alpha/beta-hydrolase [Aspergillus eucalypticola CBS 122712]PWY71169.1 alpha/beta-hydrolase [Aspergillus eucalypticola CBS 122712]